MPSRNVSRTMFATVLILAVTGVLAGSLRISRQAMGLARPQAAEAFDSAYVRFIFATGIVPADDPRHADMENSFRVGQRKFDAHPAATLLHAIPGALFLILAPLQLIPSLRARRPVLHRWSGRILLMAGACVAGSALYLVWWLAPSAGIRESLLITVIATLFLVSGTQAWLAIRAGRRAEHREWMLRFLAAGLAISTIRIVSFPIAAMTSGMNVQTAFLLSMVVGWVITLGAAEWWIRRTRPAVQRTVLEPVAIHR
jgi:uncharacterized membrane protein